MIVTGGPGTGKTTIVNGILELYDSMGLSYALAAPTGRAAKRLTEVTGREDLQEGVFFPLPAEYCHSVNLLRTFFVLRKDNFAETASRLRSFYPFLPPLSSIIVKLAIILLTIKKI